MKEDSETALFLLDQGADMNAVWVWLCLLSCWVQLGTKEKHLVRSVCNQNLTLSLMNYCINKCKIYDLKLWQWLSMMKSYWVTISMSIQISLFENPHHQGMSLENGTFALNWHYWLPKKILSDLKFLCNTGLLNFVFYHCQVYLMWRWV
jgi:hypothetical protein